MTSSVGIDLWFLRFMWKIKFDSLTPSNKLGSSKFGFLRLRSKSPIYMFTTSLDHRIKSVQSRTWGHITFDPNDSCIIRNSPNLQILDFHWELREEREERIIDPDLDSRQKHQKVKVNSSKITLKFHVPSFKPKSLVPLLLLGCIPRWYPQDTTSL